MQVAGQGVVYFGQVEPLVGFSAEPVAPPHFPEPAAAIAAPDGEDHDPQAPCLAAAARCRIRRTGDGLYLQCELSFPADAGWLELYEEGRLIDRAELVAGWQHSAVSLADASPDAELEIVFRDGDGNEANGVCVRALLLSDEWGRGHRRRLKCYMPFEMMAVFGDFSVFPCCGRQWLNGDQMAGSTKTDSLSDIWNGPQYRKMRAAFLSGDYASSCREDVCPVLLSRTPPAEPSPAIIRAVNEGHTSVDYGPTTIHHDIDRGCNLECTMCRDEKILPERANIDHAIADIQSALDLGSVERVSFSGAGEIFVMAKVVRMLESDAFSSKGIALRINTNLTHFNERLWQRIGHNDFAAVVASADGCSSEVYDAIRIGAKWEKVEENMRFLARLRREGRIGQIVWNYTVQRANVGDVGKAIRHARAIGFDYIRFIAHLGTQGRTGGNMFEDHDAAALDALYDALEAENAFEDPLVVTSELGVHGRRYRGFDYRLDLARHIFERSGYNRGDSGAPDLPPWEWEKCLRLIEGLIADVDKGVVEPPARLSEWQARFLAEVAARSAPPPRLLDRLRVVAGRGSLADQAGRRVRRWTRAMLRAAPPEQAAA